MEIAQLLKVSHVSVKRWFRSDGLLKDEYDQYEKERNGVRDRETDNVLARHAETAAKMLVSLMGARSDAIKFRAAKTILDFVLGSVKGRDDDPYTGNDYQRDSRQISEMLESIKKRHQKD